MKGVDCKLDDPELVMEGTEKKRNLGAKISPVGIIQIIIAKWKEGGQMIRTDMEWETKDPATQKSCWHWRIGITDRGIYGESADFNKQRSK